MDHDPNYFWLITLAETTVNVSLVSVGQSVVIQSTSRDLPWTDTNNELINAINNAIDACDQQLALEESQEPDRAAFIISPFWVASDGKIIESKLQLIINTCKQLLLKPMGFMPYDEAIIEEANIQDGIPASFVLAYIDGNQLIVSLTFLGKIKRRIRKMFTGKFDPVLLESSILEMNVESALPPLINLCGQVDESIGHEVRNYPWIGKKSIETFLHLPEVKVISREELIRLFARIIARQINPNIIALPAAAVEEVTVSDFGFKTVTSDIIPAAVIEPEPEPKPEIQLPLPSQRPKFTLPRIKFSSSKFFLWLYIFLGAVFLISIALHVMAKTTIDLYLTPYNFSQKINATVTSDTSKKSTNNIIPVDRKTIPVSVFDSVTTTGKKTIGDKAKGEIVIYNKMEKSIKIPKGTQLSSGNLKFDVINDTQIASSSSDLDKGVITLGQTKAIVTATDIGPEYNLIKDTRLDFKDAALTQLLAKVNNAFAGGSRQEIKAVSLADKNQLEAKLSQKITDAITNKSGSELSSLDLALTDTMTIKKNNLDVNREVGEAADELSGSQTANINVFVMTSETRSQLIKRLASLDPKYSQVDQNAGSFELEFIPTSVDDVQAIGSLILKGYAPPKINQNSLASNLTIHTAAQAKSIIRQQIPRVYDLKITTIDFSPLKFFDILPFTSQNIKIIIHSQSQ